MDAIAINAEEAMFDGKKNKENKKNKSADKSSAAIGAAAGAVAIGAGISGMSATDNLSGGDLADVVAVPEAELLTGETDEPIITPEVSDDETIHVIADEVRLEDTVAETTAEGDMLAHIHPQHGSHNAYQPFAGSDSLDEDAIAEPYVEDVLLAENIEHAGNPGADNTVDLICGVDTSVSNPESPLSADDALA